MHPAFDDGEGSNWSERDLWDLDPTNEEAAVEQDFAAWQQEQQSYSEGQAEAADGELKGPPTIDSPMQPATDERDGQTTLQRVTKHWLANNFGRDFVAAAPKKQPKASRFEGEKPGWVFKLGDRGLGYYPDKPQFLAVSLVQEVCPSGGKLAVFVPLSEAMSYRLLTWATDWLAETHPSRMLMDRYFRNRIG